MDRELAEALPYLPQLPLSDLAAARAGFAELVAQAPPPDRSGVRAEDRTVPGPQGAPDVVVRVFTPESGAGSRPGVLDIHGGGFVVGNRDLDDGVNLAIAREVGAVVVSVEYRLAPETPFPGPVEDCYAALQWLVAHAGELGVDAARVAVLGDSAGGGLAAAIALLARDRRGPALAMQVLLEPELDDRLQTHSMRTGIHRRLALRERRQELGVLPRRPGADVLRRSRPDGGPGRPATDLPDRQRAGPTAR